MTTLRRLINRLLGRHDERTNIITGNNAILVSIRCPACGPIHQTLIPRHKYNWERVGKAMTAAETRHHGRKNR